jgi:glycosyltransferase involved in cell wall biosynthesis
MAKHLVYLAIGFPPASKSSTYRLRAHANAFAESEFKVTVLNACDVAWEQEMGIDKSLLHLVNPDINIVQLPLFRPEFETNVRNMSEMQIYDNKQWLKELREFQYEVFPEYVFGSWLPVLIEQMQKLHSATPIDLIVASLAPNVLLGVLKDFAIPNNIPYAVDYRDAWKFHSITGKSNFENTSKEFEIEGTVLNGAKLVSFVNPAIRDAYASIYATNSDNFIVSRNGFDSGELLVSDSGNCASNDRLLLGYVGTMVFGVDHLKTLLTAWKAAILEEKIPSGSRFVIAGHIGAGFNRQENAKSRLIQDFKEYNVSYIGTISRTEIGRLYSEWNALVFPTVGEEFMTTGKIYEYMGTGLPIISSHSPNLEAVSLLTEYPNWLGNAELDSHRLTELITKAWTRVSSEESLDLMAKSKIFATQFERSHLASNLVDALKTSLNWEH